MPRKVRDANLETRTARSRLKVAHKPYFRLIEPGLHLGYRKLANGPGAWIARRYSGAGTLKNANLRTPDGAIVLADDFADADGEEVLSFTQAQNRVRGPRVAAGSYTVGSALDDYFRYTQKRRTLRTRHTGHTLPRQLDPAEARHRENLSPYRSRPAAAGVMSL